MLRDEVPQDKSSTYAGHKKVLYAKNAEGTYETVQSSGWAVEEAATLDAVEQYRLWANDAAAAVRRGETSPLMYHMYASRMDLPLLSQVSGLWQWRIRRHFKPHIFAGLSDSLLQRYADVFNIPLAELKKLPD